MRWWLRLAAFSSGEVVAVEARGFRRLGGRFWAVFETRQAVVRFHPQTRPSLAVRERCAQVWGDCVKAYVLCGRALHHSP